MTPKKFQNLVVRFRLFFLRTLPPSPWSCIDLPLREVFLKPSLSFRNGETEAHRLMEFQVWKTIQVKPRVFNAQISSQHHPVPKSLGQSLPPAEGS